MEQATNSFNKGLLMDTHPMVLGNDTLSDCLNGTFITMNGNEVILQNDMGNRRIDRAFLPAGYEPVGIKEHGGIIYIASYNPITNRSLIGSFPSPLRTFKGEEELTKSISFDIPSGTNTFNNITIDKANFIDNFQEIILYSSEEDKDYNLHIGDMFILYGNTESLFNDKIPLISNIFNTVEYKISLGYETGKQVYKTYSPKNRLFTLLVGILNSQNSFIDLTDTLIRWDEEGKLIESKNSNEIYKKNDGNFIKNWTSTKPKFFSDNKENEDIANRYLYKLSGPLCLRKTLNHFLNFTYVIEIDKEENNYILRITANIIYNSPDCNPNTTPPINNINSNELLGNDTYYNFLQFESNKEDFNCFDLIKQIKQIKDNLENWIWSDELYENHTIKITYNPETNLYNAIIERTYKINKNNIKDEKNFEFIIAPKLIDYNGEPLEKHYLRELCSYNKIDLSQINTGNSLVQSWNTYWDEKVLYLHYGIIVYPKMDEEYRNLRIKYRKYNTRDSFTTITLLDDNFSLVENEIKIEGLEKGLAYEVEILCDKYNKKTGLKITTNEVIKNNYWFFTTTLFNNTYAITSEDYISNIVEEENNTEELKNKLEKYKTIDEITFDTISSSFDFIVLPGTFEGEFIGLKNDDSVSDTIKYNQILTCPNTISVIPKILDKYPTNIFNISNLTISSSSGDVNYTFNIPLENGETKEFKSYKETNSIRTKLIQQISGLNIITLDNVKLINPYVRFEDAMKVYNNAGCPSDIYESPIVGTHCEINTDNNSGIFADTNIKRRYLYQNDGAEDHADYDFSREHSEIYLQNCHRSHCNISPIFIYNTKALNGGYFYPEVLDYSELPNLSFTHPSSYIKKPHNGNILADGEVFDSDKTEYCSCVPLFSGGLNNEFYNIILVYVRKKRSDDFVLLKIVCNQSYYETYLSDKNINNHIIIPTSGILTEDLHFPTSKILLKLLLEEEEQSDSNYVDIYIQDFRTSVSHNLDVQFVSPNINTTKTEIFKVDNSEINSTISINFNSNNLYITIRNNIFGININENLKVSGKINKSFNDNYKRFSEFKNIMNEKLGYENGSFNYNKDLIFTNVWIIKENNHVKAITNFNNGVLLPISDYNYLNIISEKTPGVIRNVLKNDITIEYDVTENVNRMVTTKNDLRINGVVPRITLPTTSYQQIDNQYFMSYKYIV